MSREYDVMAERLHAEDERKRKAALANAEENNQRFILSEYWQAGLEPVRNGAGMLVTLPMARKLHLPLKKIGAGDDNARD